MTIKEALKRRLVENGMFPDQAEEVMAQVIQKSFTPTEVGRDPMVQIAEPGRPVVTRWHDDAADYPPTLLTVLWVNVRHEAVDWIDANKPHAWFRAMFADEVRHDA